MNYRYLAAFHALAQYRSFTRAALELRIAVSALSRQIQLLEDSVGEPLFLRNNKEVLLTPRGRELVQALEPLEHFRNPTGSHGRVRVGTMEGIFYSRLLRPETLAQLSRRKEVQIRFGLPELLAQMLRNGELDAILTNRDWNDGILSSRVIGTHSLVLISKDAIPASPRLDLSGERWIYGESGRMLSMISRRKSTRNCRVTTLDAIIRLVEAGHGVAVVPEAALPPAFRGHVLRPAKLRDEKVYLTTLSLRRAQVVELHALFA